MSDTQAPPATAREALRLEWHEHAESLFHRLFPEHAATPGPSFADRERRAEQLARDLAVWLLERGVNNDPQARPTSAPPCPHCGKAADPAAAPDDPLPRRTLTTRVGLVAVAREKWCCKTCRRVFFPPRRRPRIDP